MLSTAAVTLFSVSIAVLLAYVFALIRWSRRTEARLAQARVAILVLAEDLDRYRSGSWSPDDASSMSSVLSVIQPTVEDDNGAE